MMARIRSFALVSVLLGVALGCHEVHLDYGSDDGEIQVFDNLFSVSIGDADHAVAVGYYGAAYYSEDGGRTWSKGKTDTQSLLYSVSMASGKVGWAVGQRGLILRTEDGGRTWTPQPNLKQDEGSHLFSVAAIDENSAVAVGEWGTRIRTRDGGARWQDRSFTITEDHPQYVWLDEFAKRRVRNGEKVYEDVGLNDVYCRPAPSQHCWLIGEFGYIFYSDDGGDQWTASDIAGAVEIEPIRTGYNEIEVSPAEADRIRAFGAQVANEPQLNVAIEAVASKEEMDRLARGVDDPTELFEVLEARSQEVISILEDEGIEPDRLRRRGQPPWDYEDFLEDDPGFLERYLVRETYDYPGVRLRVIQNPYLFTVAFRDDEHGLIAGLGGVILRSDDGGRTWAYRKIDRQQALFSADAVEGRAVAVGEKGLIRTSTDEGMTWHRMPTENFPRVFTFMRDIGFAPGGDVGLIVGQTGRIYRSTDAGFRWTKVLMPPQDRLLEEAEQG